MARHDDRAFQQRLQRIEPLLTAIAAWPDEEARDDAVECVQTILDLHGAGLQRILELIAARGDTGAAILEDCGRDELVGSLLLLHELHPLDLETRVRQALDTVRPYLALHQGNVELLAVDEGVVQLRLQGSCHGCPSSAMTLKLAIEEALQRFAPDLVALKVEGVVEPPLAPAANFVPLEQVQYRHLSTPKYEDCPAAVGQLSR